MAQVKPTHQDSLTRADFDRPDPNDDDEDARGNNAVMETAMFMDVGLNSELGRHCRSDVEGRLRKQRRPNPEIDAEEEPVIAADTDRVLRSWLLPSSRVLGFAFPTFTASSFAKDRQ